MDFTDCFYWNTLELEFQLWSVGMEMSKDELAILKAYVNDLAARNKFQEFTPGMIMFLLDPNY